MTASAESFVIPGRVDLEVGSGRLTAVRLRGASSSGRVVLQGGQVTEFGWNDGTPLLFLSDRARFAAGQAIRGGIPIVFPWFGNRDGAPAHGFARTAPWRLAGSDALDDGAVSVTLALEDAPSSIEWPAFELRLTIVAGEALSLALAVTNRAAREQTVEMLFHTYLRVGDVGGVAIHGLGGREFVDKVDGFSRKTEGDDPLRLTGETDRIYRSSGPVLVDDPALGRRLEVTADGAASTVLWNPGFAKAEELGDLGGEAYARFVCVESGNVADDAVRLAPGAAHAMRVVLSRSARGTH